VEGSAVVGISVEAGEENVPRGAGPVAEGELISEAQAITGINVKKQTSNLMGFIVVLPGNYGSHKTSAAQSLRCCINSSVMGKVQEFVGNSLPYKYG
jgi:hypothetical protein